MEEWGAQLRHETLASLIFYGGWTTLPILQRSDGYFNRRICVDAHLAMYPSAMDLWRGAAAEDEADDDDGADILPLPEHNAHNALMLADFMKRLHHRVPEDQRAGLTTECRKWVRFVDQHAKDLSAADGMAAGITSFGNRKYKAEQLVKALLMGDMLRDRSKLRRLLIMAASYVLDGAEAARVTEILRKDKYVVPSPATLTRHQLTIISAWFLRLQKRNDRLLSKGILWFNSLDASPQGYKDWLMSHGSTVLRSKLGKTFLHALSLIGLARTHDFG